ncbi:DUF4843 domain-containing protein [Sphingobacterium siyangense]|uniref:DUF4843 domain-containing protein n=1 Tax=Sphingobacterium siyangense TaxID=459529 RepID=UPI00200F65A3|nr:DUF4843 domain-containing protein [Sphingobacterium siyangense]UQA73923.1 DUF4843 domain-containing protein [Sphingobacterium siyangense]
MKKDTLLLLLLLLPLLMLCSCKKAVLATYDRSANVYFDLSDADRDSIVYTFAYDMTKAQDTIFVPVKIMGYRDQHTRHFETFVEKDSSTARADLHYDPLKSEYPLESNAGRAFMPIVVHNISALESQSVSLLVKLKASDDFGVENPTLIRARIIISAQLEQPAWWTMWLDNYSRVKHQLFLIVTEQRSLSTVGLDAPKNLYFANLLLMMLNDPFKWVKDHPEKNYVLSSNDNGQTYQFYHVDNPNRSILLKKNSASGKYYFIDESGKEVR